MVTRLLDANLPITLFDADHVHHPIGREWFIALEGRFATCPIVEGALTRWIVRIEGRTGTASAPGELRKLAANARHQFWPDDLPYAEVDWNGVLGHGQVTDAYLVALTRKHDGRLATLDRGLAALYADVAALIPS